jgi:hypothetical protein
VGRTTAHLDIGPEAGTNSGQESNMTEEKVRTEEFHVAGDELVATIRELVNEGNIRHIILKNEEGRTLIEIPLTLGVIGAVLVPVWAAIGAIAALAANLTIVVEKVEE